MKRPSLKPSCIKVDPAKVREWQERSRKPLNRTAISRSGPSLKQGGSSLKQRAISPASKAQREAAALATVCTGCGRERSEWLVLDPAHLCPRGKGGCDHELCAPFHLCRAFGGIGCHHLFDVGDSEGRRLDLLAVVNAEPDRYRAALQHALEHMNPTQLIERLAGARTQWSDGGSGSNVVQVTA